MPFDRNTLARLLQQGRPGEMPGMGFGTPNMPPANQFTPAPTGIGELSQQQMLEPPPAPAGPPPAPRLPPQQSAGGPQIPPPPQPGAGAEIMRDMAVPQNALGGATSLSDLRQNANGGIPPELLKLLAAKGALAGAPR